MLFKKNISKIFIPILLLGAIAIPALVDAYPVSNPFNANMNENEHDESNDDFYYEDSAKEKIAPLIKNQDHSPIEDDIVVDGDEYINKDYAAFKVLNNDNNFQGLSKTDYDDINGETVSVYSLYRLKSESINNPNVAIGILLYQTIQYKMAHPEEDVEVAFSSYRISCTVAVCVIPNSRYYGYMRTLYDKDYDDYGFIRISYLLVEAARMGIKVTIVGQLPSYSVYQYNDKGELKKKAEPNYVPYFTTGLTYDCYDEYAPGKKVSDFMNFVKVGWTLSDKGGTDMMHLKTCTSSAYIDNDGVEHHNAVFLSCSNLDAVDYRASNGGNWDQSGVVVSNHKYIYNATLNYVKLMYQYSYQEGMYELKNIMRLRGEKQHDLILNGHIDDIPSDELIIYPGTDSDLVFEIYFTPLAGRSFSWDEEYNPVCKYASLLANSKGSVEFTMMNPRTDTSFGMQNNLMTLLKKKYVTEKNIENRICLNANGLDVSDFTPLKAGVDIGFNYNKYTKNALHCKDFLFSYLDNFTMERQYVSLLSSCNLHSGAFYYQTNSLLVIHENENTFNRFYNYFGIKSSKGAVLRQGLKTEYDERYIAETLLNEVPKTIDTTFMLRKQDLDATQGGGALVSDNNHWSECYYLGVNANGNPYITYRPHANPDKGKLPADVNFVFDEVDVATSKDIHLTVARDDDNFYCYINGELVQTLANTLPSTLYTPTIPYVFNGSWRSANRQYFRGITKNIRLFSDTLTPDELSDKHSSIQCNFDFTQYSNNLKDKAGKLGTLTFDETWLNDVLEPTDYDYSIALIGDTQILSESYQDNFALLYDWLLKNKEKEKIAFMVGVGDITNKAYDWEYEYDKEHIYTLNGEIPYVLNRGDHDTLDKSDETHTSVKFNDVFNDEFFLSNMDGFYEEGNLANGYKKIKLGDIDYIFITLQVGATDDILEWAGQVCDDNPDCRVVITTHVYLYRDRTTLDYDDAYCPKKAKGLNSGEQIWQKLVSQHENIDYVLCGHDPCDQVTLVKSEGLNGHIVTQILSNSQDIDGALGPTGMVTLLYFKNDGTLKAIRHYSTGFEQFGSLSSQMDF